MKIVLLLKYGRHFEQSLPWLGQYATSNDRNSIQLQDELTPDPRHDSSVVLRDCDGHDHTACTVSVTSKTTKTTRSQKDAALPCDIFAKIQSGTNFPAASQKCACAVGAEGGGK